jgi:DNA-binding NarL/FixJ family response regulator
MRRRQGTQLLGTGGRAKTVEAHRSDAGTNAKVRRFIAAIEGRAFVREVICRALQSAFSLPVVAYSAAAEIEGQFRDGSTGIVILSLTDASKDACASALKDLSELVPGLPIVVLGSANDVDLARIAFRYGAKGYIPSAMGFEIAVEAVRFVLVGGTYVPMGLLAADLSDLPRSPVSQRSVDFTSRERAVILAIQHAKSNKIIAYELNIRESTVKAHVHNIMRKLQAKNRTEVAIKVQTALALGPRSERE